MRAKCGCSTVQRKAHFRPSSFTPVSFARTYKATSVVICSPSSKTMPKIGGISADIMCVSLGIGRIPGECQGRVLLFQLNRKTHHQIGNDSKPLIFMKFSARYVLVASVANSLHRSNSSFMVRELF